MSRIFAFLRHRRLRWIAAAALAVLMLAAFAVSPLNSRLTRYVTGDHFRVAIGEETAKGLHLADGTYQPVRRKDAFTATSAGFDGKGGRKTIQSISVKDVTARFNPWGILLRRWQLDEVAIANGQVQIQTYEPTPEPKPAKPWYAIFLPDRVYLKQVICEHTNVTWRLRNQPAGFFGTRLLVTPYGRDFEYHATGGRMRMALIPELELQRIHMLVTRKMLTLYNLELLDGKNGAGGIRLHGTAGVGEDKRIDAAADFTGIAVNRWLPDSWKEQFRGTASGNIHWKGANPKVESSSGLAHLRIDGGRLANVPALEKIASLSGKKALRELNMDECSGDMEWTYPKIVLKNMAIEERGKFRIEGGVSVEKGALDGLLRLGIAPEYLDWLPVANEVFVEHRGGYLWTTVHISGTLKKPKQDLSARISNALKENPGAYLELLFQQIGKWWGDVLDGD